MRSVTSRQESAKPFLELSGRFFRKRCQKDFLRFDTMMHKQMNRALEQDAGFTRNRPGSDEERAANERNGSLLVPVRVKIRRPP